MDIIFVNAVGLPDDEVAAALAASQIYIDTWLTPFWPSEAGGSTIRLGPEGDYSLISAVPNTIQAGSLGFHTTSQGIASGVVEMEACRQYDVDWSIVLTHELAELLVNPQLKRWDTAGNRVYPVEVCDPVTSSHFQINQVQVSNAVGPMFWRLGSDGGRYDLMGNVQQTFDAPLPPKGGWMEWQEAGVYANAWGPAISSEMIAYMASRQGRRHRLRHGL